MPELAPDVVARASLIAQPRSRGQRRLLAGYLAMPIALALTCLALYLYVRSQELDSIEARSLNASTLITAVREHLQLAGASTALVIVIAVPLGIVLTRPFARRVRSFVAGLFNFGQAIPTIAIFVLLAVAFLFLGFRAAIVGLVLSALIPVLLNTMVGLEQIDASVLEAGRGMGMSKVKVLLSIELPLAVPIILAGVRTALIVTISSAALATYINAGGLGDVIVAGLSTNRTSVQLVGATLTAVLALSVDYLAGLLENRLRPKGL